MTRPKPPIPLDPKDVAQRAFVLWQRRGCPCGEDLTDWYEAEAELRREALEAPDRPEWPDEDEIAPRVGAGGHAPRKGALLRIEKAF